MHHHIFDAGLRLSRKLLIEGNDALSIKAGAPTGSHIPDPQCGHGNPVGLKRRIHPFHDGRKGGPAGLVADLRKQTLRLLLHTGKPFLGPADKGCFFHDKGVEDFGLEDGDYIIRVAVDGSNSVITFYDEDDKPLKSEIVSRLYPGFSEALIKEFALY